MLSVADKSAGEFGDRDGKPSRHGVAGRDLIGGWVEDEGIQVGRHLSRRAGHLVDAVRNRAPVGRRVRVEERPIGRLRRSNGHGLGLGLADVRVGDLNMRERVDGRVVSDRLIGNRAGDRWSHCDSRRDNAGCVVGGGLPGGVADHEW